jgi:hypothetical protein
MERNLNFSATPGFGFVATTLMQSVNSCAQFLLSADFYSRTTICDHGLSAQESMIVGRYLRLRRHPRSKRRF